MDKDKGYVNYAFHPYCGAVYYMTARSYGAEAFAQVPSAQDLLITPIAGAAIGEGFFISRKKY